MEREQISVAIFAEVFGAAFAYDTSNAGQWQVVAPFLASGPQTPWAAFMRPFLLDSTSQFRAPPPPALGSEQYAKDFGCPGSPSRSSDAPAVSLISR